jgi:hypothetical protein
MSPPTSTWTDPWGAPSGCPIETAVPPKSSEVGRGEHASITSVAHVLVGDLVVASMKRVPFQSGFDASPGVAYAGGSLRCAGTSSPSTGA